MRCIKLVLVLQHSIGNHVNKVIQLNSSKIPHDLLSLVSTRSVVCIHLQTDIFLAYS